VRYDVPAAWNEKELAFSDVISCGFVDSCKVFQVMCCPKFPVPFSCLLQNVGYNSLSFTFKTPRPKPR